MFRLVSTLHSLSISTTKDLIHSQSVAFGSFLRGLRCLPLSLRSHTHLHEYWQVIRVPLSKNGLVNSGIIGGSACRTFTIVNRGLFWWNYKLNLQTDTENIMISSWYSSYPEMKREWVSSSRSAMKGHVSSTICTTNWKCGKIVWIRQFEEQEVIIEDDCCTYVKSWWWDTAATPSSSVIICIFLLLP